MRSQLINPPTLFYLHAAAGDQSDIVETDGEFYKTFPYVVHLSEVHLIQVWLIRESLKNWFYHLEKYYGYGLLGYNIWTPFGRRRPYTLAWTWPNMSFTMPESTYTLDL